MQFKKTKSAFAVILTIAMLLAMSMLPAGAAGLEKDCEFISIDFSSGKMVQTHHGEEDVLPEPQVKKPEDNKEEGKIYPGPKIEKDATLNRNVCVFDGMGAYKLGIAMKDMSSSFDYSFEIAFCASTEEINFLGGECYLIGNNGNRSGTGIYIVDDYISIYAFDGVAYRDIRVRKCDYGKWMHVVGVYEDTAKKLILYVNGEKCGTADMSGPTKFWTNFGSTSSKIMLGADCDIGGGDGFLASGAFKGKIAYAKVYETAVTADEASALFAASGVKQVPWTPNPPTPTVAPSPTVPRKTAEPSPTAELTPEVTPDTTPETTPPTTETSKPSPTAPAGQTPDPTDSSSKVVWFVVGGIVVVAAIAAGIIFFVRKKKS